MSLPYEFRYFPNYQEWARFTDKPCASCQGTPCLEGIYFDQSSELESVCLDCLTTGQVKVDIPSYIHNQLMESVRRTHSDWTDQQIDMHVAARVSALAMTPPVPWIQNNEWPVCGDDFAYYLGERNQEDLSLMAPDGNGLTYLHTIVNKPEQMQDGAAIWHALENGWATVFLFECEANKTYIAVIQAY